MADRVETFQVTINALSLSPVTTDLEFPDGVIDQIDVLFPNGCLGLVQAALLYGGTQVIPSQASSIRANNETVSFPLSGLFPSGQDWQISLVNNGLFAHTVEIRFYVTELKLPVTSTALPVPVE